MTADFQSILHAAQNLTAQDRLRLIDALWDTVPADSAVPIHEEWEAELESRVAEIVAGTAETLPWSQIRQAALARIGHGTDG